MERTGNAYRSCVTALTAFKEPASAERTAQLKDAASLTIAADLQQLCETAVSQLYILRFSYIKHFIMVVTSAASLTISMDPASEHTVCAQLF